MDCYKRTLSLLGLTSQDGLEDCDPHPPGFGEGYAREVL